VRTMIRAGIPERVAAQKPGRKTRAIFDRYAIVSAADLREVAQKRSGTAPHMGTISGTIDAKPA
jgi:hypothetical protein